MFVTGALLLFMNFGMQRHGAHASDIQVTCEAGTFTAGESASVTCKFHTNMTAGRRDFLIEHHPTNATVMDALACSWKKEEPKHKCTTANGSTFDVIVNDRLRHEISTVRSGNAGMYICFPVPADGTQSHPCTMVVKEPPPSVSEGTTAHVTFSHSQEPPPSVSERTTAHVTFSHSQEPPPSVSEGTTTHVTFSHSQDGNSTLMSIIVSSALVAALAAVVVVICIRKRRARTTQSAGRADVLASERMVQTKSQAEQQECDGRTLQSDVPRYPRAPEPMVTALSEKVKDCVNGFLLLDGNRKRLMSLFDHALEANAGKTSMNIDMSSADIKSLGDKTDAFLVVDLSDDTLRIHYVWLRKGMAGRNPELQSNPAVAKPEDHQTGLDSETISDKAAERRPEGQTNCASETSRDPAADRVPGPRYKKYYIPSRIRLGTGVQLFNFAAVSIRDFVETQKLYRQYCLVGFVFSFPCEQNQHLTRAHLTKWTKQFRCDGVEDKEVGELLRNALRDMFIPCQWDLTNIVSDDVSTLSWVAHCNTDPSCKIALILTGGFYGCYVKGRQSNEPENSPDGTQKHMNINKIDFGVIMDNEHRARFQTEYDKTLDSLSMNPGSRIVEKMVSIMYLGEIVRLILVDLVDKGLLFQALLTESGYIFKRNKLKAQHVLLIECDTSEDFSPTRKVLDKLKRQYCQADESSAPKEEKHYTDEDCRIVQYVTKAVFERAGHIAAIGLAALINNINQPDVTVAIPGKSLETYYPSLERVLQTKMNGLVKPGLTFKIVSSSDGIEMGTALIASALSSHWDISQDDTVKNMTTANCSKKNKKKKNKKKKNRNTQNEPTPHQ